MVHVGQAVMGLGGTVDYLVDTVFNYPTLAEAYKVAALNASNKLRAVSALAVGSGAPGKSTPRLAGMVTPRA